MIAIMPAERLGFFKGTSFSWFNPPTKYPPSKKDILYGVFRACYYGDSYPFMVAMRLFPGDLERKPAELVNPCFSREACLSEYWQSFKIVRKRQSLLNLFRSLFWWI